MEHKVMSRCPVCGQQHVQVKELYCPSCGTSLRGEFSLSIFDRLNEAQQEFVLIFLKDGGNIKQIERDLNISYPTVKKTLDEINKALGLQSKGLAEEENVWAKEKILSELKEGNLDFAKAQEMLKKLEEN